MELNDALRKVRALVALAEHPGTGEAEADLARRQADALMLKFAIDEAMADNAKPMAQRGKAGKIEFELAGNTENLAGYVSWLADKIARHCRVKVRNYVRFDRVWISTAYGYEGDLRYFETLYTTLRLHMLGAVRPTYDSNLSLELNCYLLHEAGFNWLEIAEMRGWRKLAPFRAGEYDMKVPYEHKDGMVWPATKVGGEIKRAYLKEVGRRGETPTKISAGGARTYRRSSMDGYVTRISERLRLIEAARDMAEAGALVLRSDALEDFFREDAPNLYTRCPRCGKLSSDPYNCEYCGQFLSDSPEPVAGRPGRARAYKPTPYDPRAYQRGTRHADTADIGGSKVGSNKKEID